MCGRYITPDQAAIERHFALRTPAVFKPSFNVAPSQLAPVIRQDSEGKRHIDLLVWGYQPSWAKRAWINARAETAWSSSAFKTSALKRRCLVPAIGWYEWKGLRAPKQPYVLHLERFRPFAFAGIWTAIESRGIGWIRNFAIVTRPAEASIESIHDRMPAIVRSAEYDAWLDPETPAADAEHRPGKAARHPQLRRIELRQQTGERR